MHFPGKCKGPLQRKLYGLNVSELSSRLDDKNILQKGSKFANRVFLSNMKERDSAPHTFFYPSQMFHLIGITTMKAHIGVQNEGKYIQIDYCFTKIQKSDQVSIVVPHSIIMI